MTLFLGFDPGLSGAVAAIDTTGAVRLAETLPVIRAGKLAWIDAPALARLLAPLAGESVAGAWVERAQAMPRQGASSGFNYGVSFGSLLALIQFQSWRMELVTPAVWKNRFGLSRDKAASIDRARLLFPGAHLPRAKDHGLAEALLIAEYGRQSQRSIAGEAP